MTLEDKITKLYKKYNLSLFTEFAIFLFFVRKDLTSKEYDKLQSILINVKPCRIKLGRIIFERPINVISAPIGECNYCILFINLTYKLLIQDKKLISPIKKLYVTFLKFVKMAR